MKELIDAIMICTGDIEQDIHANTKAAEARVRKNTLKLEKLGKQYRKESIAQYK